MADYQLVSELMKQILALSPENQHQLREQLKYLDLPPVELSERERERRSAEKLQAAGSLSLTPANCPSAARPERPLIQAKGQPVSETILEERR